MLEAAAATKGVFCMALCSLVIFKVPTFPDWQLGPNFNIDLPFQYVDVGIIRRPIWFHFSAECRRYLVQSRAYMQIQALSHLG